MHQQILLIYFLHSLWMDPFLSYSPTLVYAMSSSHHSPANCSLVSTFPPFNLFPALYSEISFQHANLWPNILASNALTVPLFLEQRRTFSTWLTTMWPCTPWQPRAPYFLGLQLQPSLTCQGPLLPHEISSRCCFCLGCFSANSYLMFINCQSFCSFQLKHHLLWKAFVIALHSPYPTLARSASS